MKQYEKPNYERDVSSLSEENEHSVKHNRLAHLIGRAATAMTKIFEGRKKKQTGVEEAAPPADSDTSDGLMHLSISVGSDNIGRVVVSGTGVEEAVRRNQWYHDHMYTPVGLGGYVREPIAIPYPGDGYGGRPRQAKNNTESDKSS